MLLSLLLLAVGPVAPAEVIAETVAEILVTGVQDHLQELGWYEGEVDGDHGPLTEVAIESFVEEAGIDEVNTFTVLRAAQDEDAPEAPEPTSTAASTSPSSSTERSRGGVSPPRDAEEGALGPATSYVKGDTVWDRLAECESGNWIDGGASFERGSARWYWGMPGTAVPPWGTRQYHGGLQFAPSTWDWVAPMVGLGHIEYAYNATREQQILVGEKVRELQGWRAWPVCSQKIGLR